MHDLPGFSAAFLRSAQAARSLTESLRMAKQKMAVYRMVKQRWQA
jgi:hypothetical protein